VYKQNERGMKNMLEIRDIDKTLGDLWLRDIDFYIPKGYIMGLVGENGAGKSTLIKVIMGLYKCTDSTIMIDGMNLYENEEKVRDIIGFVLNEELFTPDMTLRENADYYGRYYSGYDAGLFENYCYEFELNSKKKLKELSKGERMKFQFAFALCHKPKFLIMDEPLSNFDPEFREKFIGIITDFISDGEKSILISTHLIDELEQYADYITYIRKGKQILSEDIETLLDRYLMLKGAKRDAMYVKTEDIVYRQDNELSTSILVKKREGMEIDHMLSVTRPTLSEVMYYLMKEAQENGEKNIKRL
jgi:ABC-2 type transport system ATP-binding protein